MKDRGFSRSFVVVSFLMAAQPARSELLRDFQTLSLNWAHGWYPCATAIDFSAQALVDCGSNEADLSYSDDGSGIYYFGTHNGGMITEVQGSLEAITLAPEDGYVGGTRLWRTVTYVMKTGDGLYAKLIPRAVDADGLAGVLVEYYVQTDGTRNLGPSVPVEPSTWGRVKALYR